MTLYRTATGGKRHVRNCPHLRAKDVLEAAESDGEVCSWCAAELSGKGRTYYDTVQQALQRFGAERTNWPHITDLVADVDPSHVWVPASAPYIALARDGKVAVWVHRTKVEWSDGDRVEHLPGFRPGAGGGAPVQEVWGETCEKHHLQRSRNGQCGMCF